MEQNTIHSGKVGVDGKLYEVTEVHDHKTIQVGDVVRAVDDTRGRKLLLRISDYTLHDIEDVFNQCVHIKPQDSL